MTEHPISRAQADVVSGHVTGYLSDGLSAWADLITRLQEPSLIAAVEAAGHDIVGALARGNKVLVAGNGGSAAIASHVAAEFLGKCVHDRAPLPAVNLAESLSAVTAIGNDYGYEQVFVRGIAALARPGDVFIAMSTSGRSKNIVLALDAAGELGVTRIAMTGDEPREMATRADHVLPAPSTYTPRIQEVHMLWAHAWCEAVDAISQPS